MCPANSRTSTPQIRPVRCNMHHPCSKTAFYTHEMPHRFCRSPPARDPASSRTSTAAFPQLRALYLAHQDEEFDSLASPSTCIAWPRRSFTEQQELIVASMRQEHAPCFQGNISILRLPLHHGAGDLGRFVGGVAEEEGHPCVVAGKVENDGAVEAKIALDVSRVVTARA